MYFELIGQTQLAFKGAKTKTKRRRKRRDRENRYRRFIPGHLSLVPAAASHRDLDLPSNLLMSATSLRATVALATLAAVSACEVCHLHYFHKVSETPTFASRRDTLRFSAVESAGVLTPVLPSPPFSFRMSPPPPR